MKFHSILSLSAILMTACVPLSYAQEKKAPTPQQTAAQEKLKAQQEKLKAQQEAKRKADELRVKQRELTLKLNAVSSDKNKYAEKIEQAREMLSDPQYADPQLQYLILDRIIQFAEVPGWSGITRYDFKLRDQALEPAAKKILESTDYTLQQKLKPLKSLAVYYCDVKKFQEAENLVRSFLKDDLRKDQKISVLMILKDVFRLQDRYDDAMKVLTEVEKLEKEKGIAAKADLAYRFNREKEAEAILDSANDMFLKLDYYGSRQIPALYHSGVIYFSPNKASLFVLGKGLPLAMEYVRNKENPIAKRVTIANEYLFWNFGNEEMSALRRSFADVPEMKNGKARTLDRVFKERDYRLVAEIYEICAGAKEMERADIRKKYLISLGACGRFEEAAKLAGEFASDEKMKPAEQLVFKLFQAVLSGGSADEILKNADLPIKDKAELVAYIGSQALLWGKNETAEKLADLYKKSFMIQNNRSIPVKYFDTPVRNISDWRKVYPGLAKQYCDLKFRISLEDLATDVSTGRGNLQFDENAKSGNPAELTTLCDAEGLHIFLRVVDENAMKVRYGYAPGYSMEMYIAAGRNQPYTCIGTSPTGIEYTFGTTYSNKNHRRLKFDKPELFQFETQFTDKDYVMHLFFSWNNFFQKLPDNGTEYRFECLAFTPAGPYSWGGSHKTHASSSWGSLKFELTKQQVNAIRRHMLLLAAKNYKMVLREVQNANLFTIWSDPEIGDPDFYQTMLAPLEKELDSYAAAVKPEMTDEEVETIYARTQARMKGLSDEVDHLRREYLLKRLVEKGY